MLMSRSVGWLELNTLRKIDERANLGHLSGDYLFMTTSRLPVILNNQTKCSGVEIFDSFQALFV